MARDFPRTLDGDDSAAVNAPAAAPRRIYAPAPRGILDGELAPPPAVYAVIVAGAVLVAARERPFVLWRFIQWLLLGWHWRRV